MYESILVTTDGSKDANRGVGHAIDLATEHGAALYVLFVVEERIHGATPALSSDELYLESVERETETLLEDLVKQARRVGVSATPTCLRGDPFEEILAYARRHGVDVVVMGHHGTVSERPPHFMGCVHEVSERSHVPVVSVLP